MGDNLDAMATLKRHWDGMYSEVHFLTPQPWYCQQLQSPIDLTTTLHPSAHLAGLACGYLRLVDISDL